MQADDIVFLESEILPDDPTAPYGALLHPAPEATDKVKADKPAEVKPIAKPAAKPAEVKQSKPAEAKPAAKPVAAKAEKPAAASASKPQSAPVQKDAHPEEHTAWTQSLGIEEQAQVNQDDLTIDIGSGIVVKQTKKAPERTEKDKAKAAQMKEKTKANLNPWANANIKTKPAKHVEEKAEEKEEAKPATEAKPAPKAKKPAPEAKQASEPKPKKAVKTTEAPVEIAAADVAPEKDNKNIEENKTMAKDEKAKAPAAVEKVLVEGDPNVNHGKFVIKKTDNGNFVYKLYSANRRVLASPGGAYKDLSSCKSGIQSVINNAATAPIEDTTLKKYEEQKCPKWVIYIDKAGEVRLRLIASNGNVVAITNDGYTTKDAAKKGIDAIARAAQGASIVRNDDLW